MSIQGPIAPSPDLPVWLLRFSDERGDSVLPPSVLTGETLEQVRERQRRNYWPGGIVGAWAIDNPDHWVWADDWYPEDGAS